MTPLCQTHFVQFKIKRFWKYFQAIYTLKTFLSTVFLISLHSVRFSMENYFLLREKSSLRKKITNIRHFSKFIHKKWKTFELYIFHKNKEQNYFSNTLWLILLLRTPHNCILPVCRISRPYVCHWKKGCRESAP